MEYKKVDFPQACIDIASQQNIIIPKEERTDEEKKEDGKRQALFTVSKMACEWFQKNLNDPENKKAKEYVLGRWSEEIVREFAVGFAPDWWGNLKEWAQKKGIHEDLLLEAGLITESKGKRFDFFRNRIMFPVFNRTGQVIGFSGRDLSGSDDAPKYVNTRETEIYKKNRMLYGINSAWKSIREKGYAHLVEGNPDVIRLHQLGKFNTVGTCGTSLTKEHIEELKKYAPAVTIVGDGDKAGQVAVIKSGRMIVEAGMFCNVIPLPVGEEKVDPDSYFKDGDTFDDYAKENVRDYIIFTAHSRRDKCKNPDLKSKLIDDLSGLIVNLPSSSHQLYIEQLSEIIKPKKAWQDRIKILKEEEVEEEEGGIKIPSRVSLSDWEKYGFYDDNNMYYFRCKEGIMRRTNFVMQPLFHIRSIVNAKRLFKIINEFGYEQVIELAQKDLISLANFRLRLESLGNFVWEGSESDLNRLKRFIYEKTLSADEIVQLGWQKNGFWAWSNGIFNGKYVETDLNGIVAFEDTNYYLPSSSEIFRTEEKLFVAERKLKHCPGTISLHDYAQKLIDVFGENAIFGLCFYFASLYRDYIFKLFGFFPILNLFGPKGAGKSEMAISLLQFFGTQNGGPTAPNSSLPSLGDHMAQLRNGYVHIDEYKNSLDPAMIEFMKGIWNGRGRSRINMDRDKKKEETSVDTGLILTGQEMPTADIALYSRLIFLAFVKVEYTDDEKIIFNELKEIEKLGLTHITHELLHHRSFFIEKYLSTYKKCSEDLTAELDGVIIEDRVFRNWLLVISAYYTLKDLIEVPWNYEKLLQLSRQFIIRQNQETKKSNELSIFWAIVEFMANDGQIKEEVDYKIDFAIEFKSDMVDCNWPGGKNILLLNHSRIFQLYRVHGRKAGENILPIKTLEYYLKNSNTYLGKKHAVAFRIEENGRPEAEISEIDEAGLEIKKGKRRITTALAFDYDTLGISISHEMREVGQSVKSNLPF